MNIIESNISLIFNFSIWHQKSTRKTRKEGLETRAVLLIFSFELEISWVVVQGIHQHRKNGSFQ